MVICSIPPRPGGGGGAPPPLVDSFEVELLGHLDTVWPLGTLKTMPWGEKGGRFYGPGVLDMKAGVAMALTAVQALDELRIRRPVTLLLNSDEEIVKAVETNPTAVGIVDVYSITGGVKVIKIDEKQPFDPGYVLKGR